MTINRLPDYLGHMRQAIADSLAFTEGMARPDFEQDKRTQQAVVMSLIVLGEACAACATALHTVISTSTWPWFGTLCKPPYPHSKFSSIPSFQSEPGSGF